MRSREVRIILLALRHGDADHPTFFVLSFHSVLIF